MDRFVFVGSLLCIAFATMLGNAAADPSRDPCGFVSVAADEMSGVEDTESFRRVLPNVIRRVASWFQNPYNQKIDDSEQGIYFTRQTGFTFMVDCQSPEKDRRIVRSGLFGVGFLVELIAKRIFNSELYYYVQTQHGLRVYIRDNDLRRMRGNEIYLFNRLTDSISFCTSVNNCDGIGRKFDLRYHYAIAHTSSATARKLTRSLNPGCQITNASLYDGRKGPAASEFEHEHQSDAEWQNILISSCSDDRWNGLVAYNVEKARRVLFNSPPVTGSYVHMASEGLRSAMPFVLSRKMCEDTQIKSTTNSLSLGGSINGNLSLLRLFKVSGGVEKTLEFTDTNQRNLESQIFYMFNSYGLSWSSQSGSELEDVEVVASCRSGRPDTPTEIKLWFSHDSALYLVALDIDVLEETAKRVLEGEGAWRAVSSTSRINGRFYVIKGVDQYHLWRQVIQERISTELNNAVSGMDSVKRSQMIGLYTDIVMSIIFDYVGRNDRDPTAIEPI